MARGGKRSGTPGTAYPNRVDLPGKPLAPTAAPGQQYGSEVAQLQSQRAVPMAPPSPPAAPAGPPQGSAAPMAVPGAAGGFHRPTARPTEPVTAGLPSGPGPGPMSNPVLAQGQSADQTVGDLLNRLAAQPGASANIRAMADTVNAGKG